MFSSILSGGQPRYLSLLIRFLLFRLVPSSFLGLLRVFFYFSFIYAYLIVSASQVFGGFLFSERSYFLILIYLFIWFACSIPSVMRHFTLFIISLAHFSMPNSISKSWLYILTNCIRVSNYFFFFFLKNGLMSSMYIRWLIFSCDLFSCIRLCISWVCGWVASSLLQIVIVIAHLGIYQSGSLSQLSFFFLLSIRLSRFSWFSR